MKKQKLPHTELSLIHLIKQTQQLAIVNKERRL